MLVRCVQRDGENGPRLPFELDALAGIIPDRGGTASIEHVDHLLEELPLWRQLLPGRNLANVTIVRRARCIVIDEYAAAASSWPRLEFHRVQIRHVKPADDLEPFVFDPTGVWSFFLGGELGCKLGRNDCFFARR